jgi:carbon-monoxide dehydrogenase medium subunit
MTGSLEHRQSIGGGRSLLTATAPGARNGTVAGAPAVVIPTSPQEAIAAFGDGAGVTILGGATTIAPQLARGSLHCVRALLLHRAALGGIADDGTSLTFGATATLQAIADVAPEPLAAAAAIPDREIRAQGTIGGNLHWPGDLHAPLIATRARVRSVGADGERSDPIERYLTIDEPRLVLDVTCDRPGSGAFISQRRIHSATLTVISVAIARFDDGVLVAVGGAGPHGIRCRSVEAALHRGAGPAEAAATVAGDVTPPDDPLASGWYRGKVLPVLITRTLALLQERS